ncbi:MULTISPECIES: UbiA family prenyltransferase [unclassified Kaistella]|uniref:UbiA family prenyltransferase n=1 Tax=unclassified Kaistella TaxID=2762626 RepID=UPI002735F3DE|nr:MULTISPECIES: UbiA family prenyltransferase [unclassified Kaistella]MDP2454563.1 UbiA family prenyltransferase [Kaistella sp. SH11-4b]MDP2457301.1 UbiA family prenyltransferase [Kaistella sp. SH40-3]MDP2460061.1 UbiA family prenyltransferase [Kaistella sp. SH19-2b]
MKNPLFYRFSQFIAFLMGARVFVTLLLTFALYVSTFFLFNQEESLRNFVFDFRVHGIIFCSILSILAGGIINQFYDREKDQVTKPFRTRVQNFLKQKYFLYAYIVLNTFSLGIAGMISMRVFFFFLIYQFLMWFYSHKLSKLLIINNLTFVSLSLYPFFGMLFYYKTFSLHIFLMSIFIFLMLLIIDVIKDTLTKNADKIFGYYTIPNYFSTQVSNTIIVILLILAQISSALIILKMGLHSIMSYYFVASIFVQICSIILVLNRAKYSKFANLNLLRIWIFIGIISMLANGIHQYYFF